MSMFRLGLVEAGVALIDRARPCNSPIGFLCRLHDCTRPVKVCARRCIACENRQRRNEVEEYRNASFKVEDICCMFGGSRFSKCQDIEALTVSSPSRVAIQAFIFTLNICKLALVSARYHSPKVLITRSLSNQKAPSLHKKKDLTTTGMAPATGGRSVFIGNIPYGTSWMRVPGASVADNKQVSVRSKSSISSHA